MTAKKKQSLRVPRVAQAKVTAVLTEGRRLFEEALPTQDVYGVSLLDDATFTVDEVAKLFGGRTAAWLRWAERGGHLGVVEKKLRGGIVQSVVTTPSGRQLGTRCGPRAGVRHYNLVDLIEMVEALRARPAETGGFTQDEADAYLVMIYARAHAYAVSLDSRTPPPPRDVEPVDE